MSEYKPITGEIREQMEQAERIYPIVDGMQNTQVRINLAWLTERLDAIDAIHAALEAENERLRERVDKQTVGELFVRVHLDYSDMAQQLEWAAQAVRNIGGDAE